MTEQLKVAPKCLLSESHTMIPVFTEGNDLESIILIGYRCSCGEIETTEFIESVH